MSNITRYSSGYMSMLSRLISYPPAKELANGLDNLVDITIGEKRVHGQAQHTRADLICVWTTVRAELRECGLPVQGNRIVDQRWNAVFRQIRTQLVTMRSSDH